MRTMTVGYYHTMFPEGTNINHNCYYNGKRVVSIKFVNNIYVLRHYDSKLSFADVDASVQVSVKQSFTV